jgi:hypothetical protein
VNFLLLENTDFNNIIYYGLAKESNLLKKIDEWFDVKKKEYLKKNSEATLELIHSTLNEYYIIKRVNIVCKGYIYDTVETKTETLHNLIVIDCKNSDNKNTDLIRKFINKSDKNILVNLIENLLVLDNEIVIKNLINSISKIQ